MESNAKPSETLESHRLHAAQASGGASSNVMYDRLVQIIQEYNLRGNVLDYGAGVGNLTRRLSELGRFTAISAADIMSRPEGLPVEISWHSLDLNDGNALPAEEFDVVVSPEVIEHLENPRQVAREWYRLLKPRGTLLISTPNNESIRSIGSLLIRGHYQAFDDLSYPAHITALLRKDLTRIFNEAGFSNVHFKFTDQGGFPRSPNITWQQLSLGKLKGCRFSDNVIAIATK